MNLRKQQSLEPFKQSTENKEFAGAGLAPDFENRLQVAVLSGFALILWLCVWPEGI